MLARIPSCVLATLAMSAMVALTPARPVRGAEFRITFDPASGGPFDGRLLLLIAKNGEAEPRDQVAAGVDAIQIFGVDVDAWSSGAPAVVGADTFGYPVASLRDVPAGRYWVQAVLHKYETFHLADGRVLKLPMDRGEGQKWSAAPGNLLSVPREVTIDPRVAGAIEIRLDRAIPPLEPPADTPYVRHVRIQSKLLSDFWGRPMFLGAHVLLPHGFAEHPEARFPLMILHGHHTRDLGDWRETPPDPDLEPVRSARFGVEGYNRIEQAEAWKTFQQWTSPGFPRFLVVEIQHANPYYDDSYAVNSANLGPYGDAITHELIPHLERTFRGLGTPWSRFLYGGSTGGWEALAAQIFYPDDYNGAFAACPDPIDFHAYTNIDLYADTNAYHEEGPFTRVERPAHRNYLGEVSATQRDYNHLELVLGTRGRSGEQYDIWQAVYSPAGADGYPKPIWDKRTGVIDREVAEYWRQHYDLVHILRRDWATLGPKLAGKLHLYVGEMDNYHLNNAVYLAEDFLATTKNPSYGGEVDYGARAEHCWNGDQENPIWISRLRYKTMYVPKILKRIESTAPKGADLTSWRY